MAKTFSSIHLRRFVAPALAGLFMAAAGRAGGGPFAAEGTALCAGGPTRLCLHGRYEVQATWQDEHGRDHAALAMPLGRGTGAFSLIGGDSVDLLVRVPARAASDADVDVANLNGAAYAVRVFDRESGASWTRAADAAPREVFRAVASALETTDGVVAPAAALEGCVDSGHSRCLLGGRFEVRVSATGDDQAVSARAVIGGGETGLFASRAGGEADVAVRVIDGRATNGHFWLLYAALAKAEVGIEIVDRATGNTRRFMKPAGEPAGGIELEALSPAAAVVHTTLDPARAVTAAIGPAGGALQAVDAHGTTFRLVVPKNALISLQDVTLTPVATIGDLPFSGGLAGAVYLEPAGFVMSESAQLTITPSPALARAQQLSFAFRGLAGELALAPPVLGPAALVLPVHHFGGYGVGSGTAADLAAQLARVPTRLEDRLTQRLAGILLPIRRAANGAALPASVLQLLQQDYTASIKPNLVKLKLGGLEASYPVVRNWQNTAKDTAQSAKLQTQLQEIQSAEIAGGVASYNAAAAAAVAADAAVDPTAARPCKNVKAAERMFRAYALLKARGKQGLVARQKLDNCARFTVKWNTLLDWRPPSAPNMHQDVEVGMVLTWHESDGSFWFIKRSKVNEERITQPECNVFFLLEKVGEPTVSNVLLELRLRAFTWSDDLLSDLEPPSLHYEFDPGANQDWRVTCTQHYPPLPQIGPITADFSSSWSGNYTFFHTAELDGHGFRARLEQSASPGVFAEKVYNRGTDIEYFEEHTLISVFFTPR